MSIKLESGIRQRITDLYENLTDEQLATLNRNINTGIATNRPINVGATQHLNTVHGGEYVISAADDKARRDLLDKHYESKNIKRSIDKDGDVVITINVPIGD